MTKRIGSGFRAVHAGLIDEDGYFVGGLEAAEAGDTNGSGMYRVRGAKTINPSIPEPQVQTQTGDDGPMVSEEYAADGLPTGVLEMGVRDSDFVAFIGGTKNQTIGGLQIGVEGSNNANKPTACLLLTRRAKKWTEGTRAWENKAIPAASITDLGGDYQERAFTPYRYAFNASMVGRMPWGALMTETDNGATSAPIINLDDDHPVGFHAFLGDNTETDFILDYTPVSAADVHIWVEGVLQVLTTDYSVVPSTKTITFVSGSKPNVGERVMVTYAYIDSELN